MLKTITEERQQTICVCDLCGKIMSGSDRKCWLCRRDICFRCYTLLFTAEPDDLVDFTIPVCLSCQKHDELKEKITAIMAGANKQLHECVNLWRSAVRDH
jgi:hypothetical protein